MPALRVGAARADALLNDQLEESPTVSSQTFQPGPPPAGISEPPEFPVFRAQARPVVTEAYDVPGPTPVYLSSAGSGTDGWAVVALVTSLLGLSLVAVITGHVALHRISASGRRGRGMAVAGLVLGYLAVAASAAAVAWFYYGFHFWL